MKKITLPLILCIFAYSTLLSQEISKSPKEKLLEDRIPEWVVPIIEKNKLSSTYIISDTINPFYLEADFNGDKQNDIAIYVVNKENKKAGILIIHSKTEVYHIVAAGKEFGMGDSMSWVKNWKIYRGKTITSVAQGKKSFPLKNPAIRIVKSESISAYIYWSGNKYKTFNQLL